MLLTLVVRTTEQHSNMSNSNTVYRLTLLVCTYHLPCAARNVKRFQLYSVVGSHDYDVNTIPNDTIMKRHENGRDILTLWYEDHNSSRTQRLINQTAFFFVLQVSNQLFTDVSRICFQLLSSTLRIRLST